MKRIIKSYPQDWLALTLLVAKRWEKRPTPFAITLTQAPKTWEQLAYLHAEIIPKLAIALYDAGEIKQKTDRAAKLWLKINCHYGEMIPIIGSYVFDPDSFADASIERLIEIIDMAIDEAAKRNVIIEPPRTK